MTRIIGIDPGNEISGICAIENKKILYAANIKSTEVYRAAKTLSELVDKSFVKVVIEDIAPYMVRLTPEVIRTCKLIGELCYRFNTCNFISELRLVPRNSVKKWIFDSCPDICLPRINAKMLTVDKRMVKNGKKGLRKNDGEMRLPSFHYVDDRIVIAALKQLYDIPTPKPGKPNIYGLRDHNWQAMSVAAYVSASTSL